jgi:hypothetical protein
MNQGARTRLLVWFGLLGAPLAWTLELVVGYGWEEAACAPAGMRWNIGSTWAHISIFAATAAIAVAALFSAAAGWRTARRSADARGRIEFLAAGGVFVSALFLAAVVMTGGGVVALEPCAPS